MDTPMDMNHQPLDDEELQLSFDDDMHALAALGRDVDMAMDVEGFAANVDDDGALGGGSGTDADGDVFRPSALLDRRMEEEFGGAFYSTCLQASELLEKDADGFVDIEQMLLSESEEFLSAHFGDAHSDAAGLRAELTARHFVAARGGGSSERQQRLVLLRQAVASSAQPSAAHMPPKYFAGAEGSPQKRRAHRRTFGERAHSFAFVGGASLSARAPAPSTSSGDAVGKPARVQAAEAEPMHEDAPAPERAQTPVRAFAGFRSISDDPEALRTPLRRSQSSPAAAASPLDVALATPGAASTAASATPGAAPSRSMSPADALEKVAVVLQVPRDSPGRLGTFEWRIGGASAESQSQPQLPRKSRPSLAAQLGSADELDAREPGGAALPPRYFRGGTSSPQKRRVHSTTFGSFARSFSFAGASAPSDG